MDLEKNKKLVLFDGVCNLCNSSIQYIIKHDKHDIFRYAALQSEIGLKVLKEFNIDTKKTDSILLYSPGKGVSHKSTAALKIASQLGFPLNLMRLFLLVPAFIRNWVYDYIARNRYKWYGKKDECMIPTKELRSKFL